MGNHEILSPALQKYYSALKSLNEFGLGDNFFNDVASLDKFFSEFRNITFVIQKGLETEENKQIYNELRSTILTGDTLKWFIESRNKTTKEKPFLLKKELLVELYLPNGRIRLTHANLTVDFDDTFANALEAIKSEIATQLRLIELFFSVKIRFLEDGTEIDLYPKIKDGLIQMNEFLLKIKEKFPCNCKACNTLSELIKNIYGQAIVKEITFVRDYTYELNKELIVSENIEMYIGNDDADYTLVSDIRIPLSKLLVIGEKSDSQDGEISIFDVFFRFIILHTVVFQQQNHTIMPVFAIVFSDNTCKMIPFLPSTKTTFYRKLAEIIENTDFTEVVAIFYCGEFYVYPNSPEVWQTPYSERRKMATNEMLAFRMLLKNCGEWYINFDESKIDDMEYVTQQLNSLQKAEKTDLPTLDWFTPIKEKMGIIPPHSSTQREIFVPAASSACLCGSGNKFERCCANNLPGFDIREKTQKAIEAGDYEAALTAARSDVTQYTIWHKTNTAPCIRVHNNELSEQLYKLLNIDVEALNYYVQALGRCYKHLNRIDEFPAVLERLRSNIDHHRWHRKITYLQILQTLGKDWDREVGKKEFKKLGAMDEETDVEILQLYTDLFRDELSFSIRQSLTERIANLADEPAERLHYQVQNAINLLMVKEEKEVIKKLQSAIHDYNEVRDEDSESAYALNIYASAIELLGQMQQDKYLLDRAVDLFRKFTTLENLSKEGLAHGYRKLGDALYSSSSWQEAKEAYVTSLEFGQYEISKVFISKCLLCLDDLTSAREVLSTIETATLDITETADYVFTFAQLAIESGEKEDLTCAEQILRTLEIAEPYFNEYKNTLLISVIDTLHSRPSKKRALKMRNMLQTITAVFSRYVLLEPNFIGIGLKVGKILEDYMKSPTAKSKKK